MRSIGLRLPILAMIVLASSSVPGSADEVLYLETADWVPTASVLALPTAYVVPRLLLRVPDDLRDGLCDGDVRGRAHDLRGPHLL